MRGELERRFDREREREEELAALHEGCVRVGLTEVLGREDRHAEKHERDHAALEARRVDECAQPRDEVDATPEGEVRGRTALALSARLRRPRIGGGGGAALAFAEDARAARREAERALGRKHPLLLRVGREHGNRGPRRPRAPRRAARQGAAKVVVAAVAVLLVLGERAYDRYS